MSSPERIRLGHSHPRLGYINALKDAWSENDLVLFLGAGLSAPYQIPTWKELVLELVLSAEKSFDKFWREYQMPLADWMATEFSFDLLALSRVVKYRLNSDSDKPPPEIKLKFAEAVHTKLYAAWKSTKMNELRNQTERNTSLAQLARHIKRAQDRGTGPVAIVTMNFDDLLEQELKRAGAEYHTVCEPHAVRGSRLPIIHPHGFLPENDPNLNLELVFSEDEYHQLGHTPFHWAVTEMLVYMRRNPTLFVGLSMADQTLRRLLDATIPLGENNRPNEEYRRFVLRRDYVAPEDEGLDAAVEMIQRAATANQNGNEPPRKGVKTKKQVVEAIERMVKQAHTFDRQLFKDMGVGVVWYRQHDDIPLILDEIAKPRK